jgi:hypothetical protein
MPMHVGKLLGRIALLVLLLALCAWAPPLRSAAAAGQVEQRVPATTCVQSFCTSDAQCTCPGASCVDNVCTGGTSGGGGGGGGGHCERTFCATSANCTCSEYPDCIDGICQ